MNAINGQSEIEMPTSYRYHNDKATFHRNYDANRKCSPIMPLGLRVKMCVWLGVSRGLDLAFLNAD